MDEQSAVKSPQKNNNKKPVVIVADDNESFLLLVKRILDGNGYECVATSSPEKAIIQIMELNPAVVLCDINFGLGRTTGMDIINNIRRKNIDVPFIILSAFFQEEFREQAAKLGIVDYLTKPVDPPLLLETLKKYTSTH